MQKPGKAELRSDIAAVGVVAAAAFLHQMWRVNYLPHPFFGLLRSFLYIGLAAAWGVSLRQRILQKQVRKYLTHICMLMVLWMAIRTCKFFFFYTFPGATRVCWYGYYVAFILMPLFWLFAAVCFGKEEDYRISTGLRMLLIPAFTLIILILSNDSHQLAFSFPYGLEKGSKFYTYGPVYKAAFVWILFFYLASVIIIAFKSRTPDRKKILWPPFVIFGGGIGYALLYYSHVPYFSRSDMTTVFCVFQMLLGEALIRCDMIPVNTHYTDLFEASSLGAQITDKDYSARFLSKNAAAVPKEMIFRAEQQPVLADSGTWVCAAPIRAGHVVWQKDISELVTVLTELEATQEQLRDKNEILRQEYISKHHLEHLREQNRMYDAVQKDMADRIRQISDILDAAGMIRDEAKKRRLLIKAVVIGVYLKRRSNLIFLSAQKQTLPVQELRQCLEESMRNAALGGTSYAVRIKTDGELSVKMIRMIYDTFETILEASLDSLTTVLFCLSGEDGMLRAEISAECGKDLSGLLLPCKDADVFSDEDNVWHISVKFGKGGGSA